MQLVREDEEILEKVSTSCRAWFNSLTDKEDWRTEELKTNGNYSWNSCFIIIIIIIIISNTVFFIFVKKTLLSQSKVIVYLKKDLLWSNIQWEPESCGIGFLITWSTAHEYSTWSTAHGSVHKPFHIFRCYLSKLFAFQL